MCGRLLRGGEHLPARPAGALLTSGLSHPVVVCNRSGIAHDEDNTGGGSCKHLPVGHVADRRRDCAEFRLRDSPFGSGTAYLQRRCPCGARYAPGQELRAGAFARRCKPGRRSQCRPTRLACSHAETLQCGKQPPRLSDHRLQPTYRGALAHCAGPLPRCETAMEPLEVGRRHKTKHLSTRPNTRQKPIGRYWRGLGRHIRTGGFRKGAENERSSPGSLHCGYGFCWTD